MKMIIMSGESDEIEYFNNNNYIKNTRFSLNKTIRTSFYYYFIFINVIVKK